MENHVENSRTENNKYNIIVIGAGIAGLSAAYHLCKNGFNNIKILEARKRIGGRIIDIHMGNQKVELGAKWIHGVLGNPIYEFAMTHGLVDIMQVPKPHKMIAATEGGKQVPFSILQEISEAYLCFLRRCEEYFVSQYSPPEGVDSVGDHIKLEINLYLDTIRNPTERHLRKLIFDCLLKRETCISGCDDMSEIDLFEIGSYTELQGGNITLPKGYSSVLEPLTKILPSDSLLVDHPVAKIHWNCNSRRHSETGNESDDSDQTVVDELTHSQKSSRESSCEKQFTHYNAEVLCVNGKKFHADHVICTIPLGVLKEKASELFEPPLPSYKLEAIDRLLFGTVDKILLEYDRPFLNPDITEVLLLWEDGEMETRDVKDTWYKKIYSFSKISETVLLGWISGKEAEYMETLSSDIVINTCTDILRKFLNDPFIPKPKNCVW